MRLTFFCPSSSKPVGGIKVIYRLAELCDQLLGDVGEASVLHPNQPWVQYDWFDARPKQRRLFFRPRWVGKPSFSDIGHAFSPEQDVVVLPEIWVRKYGVQLAQKKIPFAILVQGGYMMAKGRKSDLDAAFAAAKLIWSVSDNTSACLRQAFPFAGHKIRPLRLHVDASKFKPASEKENLISYMPRKLPAHIDLWKFFIAAQLPDSWKLQAIDGQDEAGVARLLGKSKIFLSMSYLEGLGLPPIEAALAGNVVLGYTGEGGKAYWQAPLFHEVPHGDLIMLSQKTIELLPHTDDLNATTYVSARQHLAGLFSAEAQRSSVEKFLDELMSR
ncbi:MAG: hypothetical protein ACKO71_09365 [Betaproteobacteria bacterium]